MSRGRLKTVLAERIQKFWEELARERINYHRRYECTVCGAPKEWYQLEPGTGRCTACQP